MDQANVTNLLRKELIVSTQEKLSLQNVSGMDIHFLSRCRFPRKSASPAGRYRCPIGRRRACGSFSENQHPSSDRPRFRLSESFKWHPCHWHSPVGNRHLEIYSEGCIRERLLCGCLSRKGKRRVKPRQIPTPSSRKVNSKYVLPSSRLRQSLSRRRPGGGGASARQAVFDLVGGNASLEREATPEVASIQNLMTEKEAVGLIV